MDRDALDLAPLERWERWEAAPVATSGDSVRVVMVNPRDAFLSHEIEKALGKKVYIVRYPMEPEQIKRLLEGDQLDTREKAIRRT